MITAQSATQHFFLLYYAKSNKQYFLRTSSLTLVFRYGPVLALQRSVHDFSLFSSSLNFFFQFIFLQTLQINGPEVEC